MKTLITAFCTQVSGDGDPYIKLQFKTLDAMHEAHNELLTALRQFDAPSHPTPVQGEALPVVAYMMEWGNHSPSFTTDKSDYVTWFAGEARYPDALKPLTDHAQATAEIARLQGFLAAAEERSHYWHGEAQTLKSEYTQAINVELAKVEAKAMEALESMRIELATLRTQLSTALAESGEFRIRITNMRGQIKGLCPELRDAGRDDLADKCIEIAGDMLDARHTTTQDS